MAAKHLTLSSAHRLYRPQAHHWLWTKIRVGQSMSPSGLYRQSSPFSSTAISVSSSALASQRLYDKVAIVTGASSGMGRAFALAFAAEGARLIVCADLQAQTGETAETTHEVICQRYGKGKAIFVKADVCSSEEVKNCVAEAVSYGQRLDMYVSCPDILYLSPGMP